jgi:hypothetical protein
MLVVMVVAVNERNRSGTGKFACVPAALDVRHQDIGSKRKHVISPLLNNYEPPISV